MTIAPQQVGLSVSMGLAVAMAVLALNMCERRRGWKAFDGLSGFYLVALTVLAWLLILACSVVPP